LETEGIPSVRASGTLTGFAPRERPPRQQPPIEPRIAQGTQPRRILAIFEGAFQLAVALPGSRHHEVDAPFGGDFHQSGASSGTMFGEALSQSSAGIAQVMAAGMTGADGAPEVQQVDVSHEISLGDVFTSGERCWI
jgi:hypothetical protein